MNRWVFSDDLKEAVELLLRRLTGREFQTRGAENEKALSPNDFVLTRGFVRIEVSADERRVLVGVYG